MPRKLTSQKREDLVRGAVKVFMEKGFRDASVKEIVTEAGASTATFYRYFQSKDDVYVEIVMKFLEGFVSVWGKNYELLTGKASNRKEAIRYTGEAFRSILDYYRENRDVARIVFPRLVPVDERFAELSEKVVRVTIKQLEEIVESLKSLGLAGAVEPRVGAAIAVGAVFGIAVECVVDDERDDIDNLVGQLMGVVSNGITRTSRAKQR